MLWCKKEVVQCSNGLELLGSDFLTADCQVIYLMCMYVCCAIVGSVRSAVSCMQIGLAWRSVWCYLPRCMDSGLFPFATVTSISVLGWKGSGSFGRAGC